MTSSSLARTKPQGVISKARLADIALALTYVSITSLLVKSGTLLEHLGYHYIKPGGFPWEKFHPGTLIACCALAARILAANDVKAETRRLLASDPLISLYLLSLVIAAAHAVVITKNPVSGLVDTFLLPVILFALTKDLDPRIRRSLALLICAFMAGNACIALAEYLTGWRLVPVVVDFRIPEPGQAPDPDADPGALVALFDWRATALLGHSLENALVTGALILCLASPGTRWLRPMFRFPLLALSLLALVAFGGRSSLVLAIAGALLFGIAAAARKLAAGTSISRRGTALALFSIPIVCSVAWVAVESGFFDRLVSRFVEDSGSAAARIQMWDMFQPLTTWQILLGPDPDVLRLQQHLLGLELGIESFWIGLTLAYGLIIATLMFIGLALLAVRIVLSSGPGASAILIYFFLNASTSTSLSSKTTTFGLVILLILVLLQKDRRCDILIPGLYASTGSTWQSRPQEGDLVAIDYEEKFGTEISQSRPLVLICRSTVFVGNRCRVHSASSSIQRSAGSR